jgi:hypothetical protein
MASPSLVKTASQIRRGVVIFLIVAVAIILFDTVSKFLSSGINPFNPTISFYLDPNTTNIGEVPKPKIPSLAIAENSKPTFSVEGLFPAHPDTAFVYKIETPVEKLNTVENAIKTAKTLGFTNNYTQVNADLTWENNAKTRKLQFNKTNQTWKLRTQYFLDAEALKPKSITEDVTTYANRASGIVASLGFSEQSLNRAKVEAVLAKLGINGLFTNPISASSADYVVIDMYRQFDLARLKSSSQLPQSQRNVTPPPEFDGKVYTDDPRVGSLHMVITDADNNDPSRVVYEFDFTNYTYNYNYGIYRVITPAEAWDKVQQGEGSLTLLQTETADYFAPSVSLEVTKFAVDATKTEIAYWEPPVTDTNRFEYPIYVFRGRAELAGGKQGRFVFYVDALKRLN